jgi:hypothetical protein
MKFADEVTARETVGSRMLLATVVCALLGAGAPLPGQEVSLLVPTKTVPKIEFAGPLFAAGPPCDSDGNMYLRALKSDQVEKLSREGKVVARFSLSAVEVAELQKLGLDSYAADQRGSVFGLVHGKGTAYVVEFGPDGKYEKTIKLDVAGLRPYRLTVFPTGELLVSGVVRNSETNPPHHAPYTAIFDPQGRLIKDLSLPGDVSRESVGAERKSAGELNLSDADLAVQKEVLGGLAAIGPDGNACLFRNIRPPIMYVISAGGILVRRIALKPPSENVVPLEESISGGRVLVEFGHETVRFASEVQYYSLYDALTGEHLYDYKNSPELNAGFACYTQNAFLFIGMGTDRNLALIEAQPR